MTIRGMEWVILFLFCITVNTCGTIGHAAISDDDEKTDFNIEGLEKLTKLFAKAGAQTVHTGILGGGVRETTDGVAKLTNAQIGAFHEFGTVKMPMRSFLRIPLINHLDKRIRESGIFGKDLIDQALKAGTLYPVMQRVAIVAEDVVLGAFDSGGYGDWPPSNFARKKNAQTLVETQQLRNAIVSEVVEGEGDD